MKQVTKCHAFQVYVVVENRKFRRWVVSLYLCVCVYVVCVCVCGVRVCMCGVRVYVCVVCVCVCLRAWCACGVREVFLAALGARIPFCSGGLVVSLNDTHEAEP
jgi:hypothetical protein